MLRRRSAKHRVTLPFARRLFYLVAGHLGDPWCRASQRAPASIPAARIPQAMALATAPHMHTYTSRLSEARTAGLQSTPALVTAQSGSRQGQSNWPATRHAGTADGRRPTCITWFRSSVAGPMTLLILYHYAGAVITWQSPVEDLQRCMW